MLRSSAKNATDAGDADVTLNPFGTSVLLPETLREAKPPPMSRVARIARWCVQKLMEPNYQWVYFALLGVSVGLVRRALPIYLPVG